MTGLQFILLTIYLIGLLVGSINIMVTGPYDRWSKETYHRQIVITLIWPLYYTIVFSRVLWEVLAEVFFD